MHIREECHAIVIAKITVVIVVFFVVIDAITVVFLPSSQLRPRHVLPSGDIFSRENVLIN